MKPQTYIIIGLLAYFATSALNRFLGERNYGSLSQEDKLKLTDAFSKQRSLATYIPIGIFLVAIAIVYANPQTFSVVFPAGFVMILFASLVMQVAIFRRLTELSLPGEYVTKFRIQSTLVQIGNIITLSLLAYGIVMRIT